MSVKRGSALAVETCDSHEDWPSCLGGGVYGSSALPLQEAWFVWIMTDQMQTNVTQLFPNAPYLLRVAAMSPKGLGDPSEPFPVVMTEPGGERGVGPQEGGVSGA